MAQLITRHHAWFIALLFFPMVSGCLQTRVSEPPRTALEQLLLSTAADRSLQQMDWELFKDKRVFVDPAYFDGYDKSYAVGTLRNLLSIHGALLATNAAEAEIIVEARSGALSTDSSSSMIGMPSLPIPIPLTGTFSTPELYLSKSEKLFSTAKILVFAYDQKSRRHLFSSGSMVGRASHKHYRFLGYISFTRTDIPEKK